VLVVSHGAGFKFGRDYPLRLYSLIHPESHGRTKNNTMHNLSLCFHAPIQLNSSTAQFHRGKWKMVVAKGSREARTPPLHPQDHKQAKVCTSQAHSKQLPGHPLAHD
jgi:hypothetical protein